MVPLRSTSLSVSLCHFTPLIRIIIVVHILIIILTFDTKCTDDVCEEPAQGDEHSASIKRVIPSVNVALSEKPQIQFFSLSPICQIMNKTRKRRSYQ